MTVFASFQALSKYFYSFIPITNAYYLTLYEIKSRINTHYYSIKIYNLKTKKYQLCQIH
jgi:hypothetical protein